jgi:hypothetical protein
MPDMPTVRKLIVSVKTLAPVLNQDEINSIAAVLYSATKRLLKEAESDA